MSTGLQKMKSVSKALPLYTAFIYTIENKNKKSTKEVKIRMMT